MVYAGPADFESTSDIDFAIYIPEEAKFNDLKRFLSNKWNFTESRENSFAMISSAGISVDILPFGTVEFTEDRKVEGVATNGFIEVYRKALETFERKGQLKLKVATLPAIILLKMVAFQDRPEMRLKNRRIFTKSSLF